MADEGIEGPRTSTESIVRRDTIRAASSRGSRKLQSKRLSAREAAPREIEAAQPGNQSGNGKAPVADTGSSVFVAYAREDLAQVAKLVARLRRAGVAVTWDQDFAAGVHVRQTIKSAIEGADAVIVVWSEAAAESLFVMDEADWAMREKKLVPTHVAGFDPLRVPVGFGQIQTVPINVPGQVENSLAVRGMVLGG